MSKPPKKENEDRIASERRLPDSSQPVVSSEVASERRPITDNSESNSFSSRFARERPPAEFNEDGSLKNTEFFNPNRSLPSPAMLLNTYILLGMQGVINPESSDSTSSSSPLSYAELLWKVNQIGIGRGGSLGRELLDRPTDTNSAESFTSSSSSRSSPSFDSTFEREPLDTIDTELRPSPFTRDTNSSSSSSSASSSGNSSNNESNPIAITMSSALTTQEGVEIRDETSLTGDTPGEDQV